MTPEIRGLVKDRAVFHDHCRPFPLVPPDDELEAYVLNLCHGQRLAVLAAFTAALEQVDRPSRSASWDVEVTATTRTLRFDGDGVLFDELTVTVSRVMPRCFSCSDGRRTHAEVVDWLRRWLGREAKTALFRLLTEKPR